MILPKMSHMVVPISKENMVTHTSIIVSGSCLPYPTKQGMSLWFTCHLTNMQARQGTLGNVCVTQKLCSYGQWCRAPVQ